jgi:GNAT superfamily N-acetyltransferase
MATVRTIREDELDDLLTLYRMLNPEDPELDTEALAAQWDAMLADEHLEVIVAEHDDKLVATCMLSITPNLTRGARSFALAENVVTHEDYRGNGFASRCLEKALDIAEERGCYRVSLMTGSDDEGLHDFYESNGFEKGRKTAFEHRF